MSVRWLLFVDSVITFPFVLLSIIRLGIILGMIVGYVALLGVFSLSTNLNDRFVARHKRVANRDLSDKAAMRTLVKSLKENDYPH